MKFSIKLVNTLTLLCVLGLSQSVFADLPMISNMQIMAQPPGAKVTAGFFTIKNTSSEQLILTGVSSDTVSRIEMHETVVKNDVASMIKQNELIIEAGDTLKFKHGGFHLMLMDLSTPLMMGSTVNVTLHSNQGDIEMAMPVIKAAMMPAMKPAMKHDE